MENVQNRLENVVAKGLVSSDLSAGIEAGVNQTLLSRRKLFLGVLIEWSELRGHPVLSMTHLHDERPAARMILLARDRAEAEKELNGYIDEVERMERGKPVSGE